MKSRYYLLLPMFFSVAAKAQMLKPVIKAGTTFYYTFELNGQHASFEISIKKFMDTLTMGWKIRGLANGLYIITPAAWQNADMLYFAQPELFSTIKLKDNETYLMLSKNAFHNLLTKKSFIYNNTVYTLANDLKTNAFKLGNDTLDVIHITAKNETTELWILNNPDFPMICQIKGNPLGINIELNTIK